MFGFSNGVNAEKQKPVRRKGHGLMHHAVSLAGYQPRNVCLRECGIKRASSF
jgi:hypothetical protein